MEIARTKLTKADYQALPESNLPMERIHGELIVSPTPIHAHQKVVFKAAKVVEQLAPGGEVVIAPMDVYFGEDDNVQPDVFWVSGTESRCKLGEDGYWYGAPDLVIEVLSPSTEYRDRHDKYELYEQHGVQEYWPVNTVARFIEVYRLE